MSPDRAHCATELRCAFLTVKWRLSYCFGMFPHGLPEVCKRIARGMPSVSHETSALLVVDLQAKLIPAIDDGASVLANAQRLLAAADMLQVPVLFTEQNAQGLGSTVPELGPETRRIVHKMTFDACRT